MRSKYTTSVTLPPLLRDFFYNTSLSLASTFLLEILEVWQVLYRHMTIGLYCQLKEAFHRATNETFIRFFAKALQVCPSWIEANDFLALERLQRRPIVI